MTRTLSVNSNNDIFLDKHGNLSISTDLQAVLELCAHVAKAKLGEMVLNTDRGIPFFQSVWNGIPNVPQFNAALRQAFLNVEGVVEVVSLITAQVDDALSYTAVIRTIFGSGAITSG